VSQYRSKIQSLGFFGGTFWRMHGFARAGDTHAGHRHKIDHSTLVSQGGVRCEIEGRQPLEYWAPAVIEINKDIHHKFTALADGTVYFCVFATDNLGETMPAPTLEKLRAELCADCKGCDQ
jgi:hypothetical protein